MLTYTCFHWKCISEAGMNVACFHFIYLFMYFIFTAHNNKLHNIFVFDENERRQKEENVIISAPFN